MSYALAFVRVLPLPFFGRLALAFAEIVVAGVLVSGSVVLGHDLKEWRAWYWDPQTTHPWAPTPTPPGATAALAVSVAAPVAAASAVAVASSTAPTPRAACDTSMSAVQLAFVRPIAGGADCVFLADRTDGTHVIIETNHLASADLGVVAASRMTAEVATFTPRDWPNPVVVVSAPTRGGGGAVLVFTWADSRAVRELFRAGSIGRVDVAADTSGWPRITMTSGDAGSARMHHYGWNGKSFVEQG